MCLCLRPLLHIVFVEHSKCFDHYLPLIYRLKANHVEGDHVPDELLARFKPPNKTFVFTDEIRSVVCSISTRLCSLVCVQVINSS